MNFAPVLETKVGTYAAVHVQCSLSMHKAATTCSER